MPTPDEIAAGTAVGSTATLIPDVGAGATGGQPDYKAMYEAAVAESKTFQSRFTGLQGTYQREQEKWKSDAATLASLTEQVKTVTTEKERLAAEKATLAEEQGKANAELGILKTKNDRFTTVIEKFPALLEFLDVLPDGVGPEWEAKLVRFQSRLEAMGANEKKKLLETSTPPPPSNAASINAEGLLVQAKAAALKGDMVEYDKLYSMYLKEKSVK